MPTMSREVATGRRINGRDGLMEWVFVLLDRSRRAAVSMAGLAPAARRSPLVRLGYLGGPSRLAHSDSGQVFRSAPGVCLACHCHSKSGRLLSYHPAACPA